MRYSRTLYGMAVSVLLAACSGDFPPTAPVRTVQPAAPIRVDYIRNIGHLDFLPGSAVLPQSELLRLRALIAANNGPDGLHVTIGLRPGDRLAGPRFAAMALALRSSGVIVTGTGPMAAGDTASPDQATLELGRYVATAAPCGDDRYRSLATLPGVTVRTFGCTTSANFAAMLADPRDLAAPQAHGAFDAVPMGAAVWRYQRDQVTPLMVIPDLPFASVPGQGNPGGAPGAGSGPAPVGSGL
jgi:pilus biogenesis lipoprotein CpaD